MLENFARERMPFPLEKKRNPIKELLETIHPKAVSHRNGQLKTRANYS
ncbi:hypothetical protein [Bacillus sp. REN3]|nr:hypothetical protein [Bacillus sp. REN3]